MDQNFKDTAYTLNELATLYQQMLHTTALELAEARARNKTLEAQLQRLQEDVEHLRGEAGDEQE